MTALRFIVNYVVTILFDSRLQKIDYLSFYVDISRNIFMTFLCLGRALGHVSQNASKKRCGILRERISLLAKCFRNFQPINQSICVYFKHDNRTFITIFGSDKTYT